jgi:glycine dehydrogenase subunit 2
MSKDPGRQGLVLAEPLIFEKSKPGRLGISLPSFDIPKSTPPKEKIRKIECALPEVSELGVVRHFTRLSSWNFSIDTGSYPLGSCTMKYNPRVNEVIASFPGFSHVHPYQPEELSQGALRLMYELEHSLAEISGMDKVSLQPAAGAQGELAGVKMIRKFHESSGNPRKKILIPDTAHGTNPASCTLSGYAVVSIKTEKGILEASAVSKLMDEDVAALMLTNPNTLGLFETEIKEICKIVHDKGALVYCDGANLNAIMGIVKLGELGIDVMHFNLHKTFSTPHGGGGPGAGPVGVKKILEPFLPTPLVERSNGTYHLRSVGNKSIGRLKGFYGNFLVLVRAYAYIRALGASGLKRVSEMAVLNANYLKSLLIKYYDLPFNSHNCMHEVVFSDRKQQKYKVNTLDIAKRLLDKGFHPPTIYFPLVVHGALMLEPTETESKEEIELLANALIEIAKEAKDSPKLLKDAPHNTIVGRVDETRAARNPRLRWRS